MANKTRERKANHIKICLEEEVRARHVATGFRDVLFVHRSLPEVNREKIDLSTVVFNHKFRAPLIVGAMTGGTTKAKKINASIAEAVEELNLGMSVGSQRVAIEDRKLEDTFSIARTKAPKAFLMANLGIAQLVEGFGIKEVKKTIDMIEADALAIHLNPLQEAVQPEGDTNYSGALQSLEKIIQELDIPVIVKETGAGIAAEEAKKLESIGVMGIDVAGAGGTSWAAVEYHRAKRGKNTLHQRLSEALWDWGIPSAVSIVEVAESVRLEVIASGGVSSGFHVAKSIALGASLASVASAVLRPAAISSEEVKKTLQFIIEELRNVMFLVGADSTNKLRRIPVVVTGKTAEWLRMRGFEPERYARRKV